MKEKQKFSLFSLKYDKMKLIFWIYLVVVENTELKIKVDIPIIKNMILILSN